MAGVDRERHRRERGRPSPFGSPLSRLGFRSSRGARALLLRCATGQSWSLPPDQQSDADDECKARQPSESDGEAPTGAPGGACGVVAFAARQEQCATECYSERGAESAGHVQHATKGACVPAGGGSHDRGVVRRGERPQSQPRQREAGEESRRVMPNCDQEQTGRGQEHPAAGQQALSRVVQQPAGDRSGDPERDRQRGQLESDLRGAGMCGGQVVGHDEQRPEQHQVGDQPGAQPDPERRTCEQGRESISGSSRRRSRRTNATAAVMPALTARSSTGSA